MNIYLTGMMGCGKSSIGRLLARLRNGNFIDLDIYIEAKCSKSISKIFEEDGEPVFRRHETEVLKDVSRQPNQVVATGGGIVLRDENVETMRNSGIIVFIDRAVEDIVRDVGIGTRPVLRGDKERIYTVYKERVDRYRKMSDMAFENRYDGPNEAATALHKRLEEEFTR